MDFSLNEAQTLLQETFDRAFRQNSTGERIRATESTGFDPALWNDIVELGAPMMRVPEEHGGGGFSLFDALLVAEAAGRYLVSAPLIESIVVARLLSDIASPEALKWLDRVSNGAVVTLALQEVGANGSSGRQLVPGGAVAEGVVVLRGSAVVLLPLEKTEGKTANLGLLPIAHESLSEGGTVLAEGAEAQSKFRAAFEEWKLLTASAVAAASRRALEMAADYAKERLAFGKPIGSYQGLAHPLADSWTDIDSARLLTWRAVWALGHDRDHAASAISMAYWWTVQAAPKAVIRSMRAFGGYGVTLEYDAQLYFRRARAWSLMAGDPQEELTRLGDRLFTQHTTPLPDAGEVTIDIAFDANSVAFGETCSRFFDEIMTDDMKEFTHYTGDGHDVEVEKKLAQGGFLFPDWPAEYGGTGRSKYDISAMRRAYGDHGWWTSSIGVTNLVGKIVLAFASEEVKAEILPKFASGESYAALAYSEPSGGSDIFAAKTRADWDGKEWVINGQKMFTSQGHIADFALLIARTNHDVPKHKGITLFMVPLNQPGYECHEIKTIGGERTNTTFYSDVKVPDRYRLGEVDGGTKVLSYALVLEQSAADHYVSTLKRQLGHVLNWAKKGGDAAPIHKSSVRKRLAYGQTLHDITDMLGRRCLWSGIVGQQDKSFGPMAKLFGSEAWITATTEYIDLAAPESILEGMDDLGTLELEHRRSIAGTVYAGSSEVMRSVIAESALQLPRSRV